jgi:hypothetical protein
MSDRTGLDQDSASAAAGGNDHDTPAVTEAKGILGGVEIKPEQAKDLVNRLKREDEFRWARRVLAKVRAGNVADPELRVWLTQQHALCTYKDSGLPVLKALEDALAILEGSLDLAETENQETLGLAGAIHKRCWQATGQKDHLERSYGYYRRGYEVGLTKDLGYTAINAAFILDQLAAIEERNAAPSSNHRRVEAKIIRETIVAELVPLLDYQPSLFKEWWYLVTVAEAFFGLQDYNKAKEWLERAKAIPNIPEWEFRSTAFQLAALHQLQHPGAPALYGQV